MRLVRIIPLLMIKSSNLYKSKKFDDLNYIGDIYNAVKIFSEKKAHELILLDIDASKNNEKFNIDLIKKIRQEIFIPLTIGGGIQDISDASILIENGVEKVSINNAFYKSKNLVNKIANKYGSQSAVVSLDVRKIGDKYKAFTLSGTVMIDDDIGDLIKKAENEGAGEIILTSIDNEGMQCGYDIDLYSKIQDLVSIPVVAHGGCKNVTCFEHLFKSTKITTAAASSLFVYYGSRNAVLINYPEVNKIDTLMENYRVL
jgi:cyclase